MNEKPMGQRRTRQREAILEVIRDAAGPLTVPEIHQASQRIVPGLGVATVYRTLGMLQEAEAVRTVVLPSGEPRYESAGRGHHHHFHCRLCNTVFDLATCPVKIPRDELFEGGYLVQDHEITLYGHCPECRSTSAPQ
jgi:Fur family transcriptional regulator, ferric uptake regulator